jgi:prepilin-type N-terminal cleavage/methylation domain-containing protein
MQILFQDSFDHGEHKYPQIVSFGISIRVSQYHPWQKTGFTLLEMTVVLAVLAIVASLVVVNYREPVTNIRLEYAFETVERLDQRVRHWCKTNNASARIKVDLDRNIFAAVNESGNPLPIPEAKLPGGMKVGELRIRGVNRFGRDTQILYSSRGTAPSWAFSIAYSGNREKYRFIIGGSGQSVSFDNEDALIRFERLYEWE